MTSSSGCKSCGSASWFLYPEHAGPAGVAPARSSLQVFIGESSLRVIDHRTTRRSETKRTAWSIVFSRGKITHDLSTPRSASSQLVQCIHGIPCEVPSYIKIYAYMETTKNEFRSFVYWFVDFWTYIRSLNTKSFFFSFFRGKFILICSEMRSAGAKEKRKDTIQIFCRVMFKFCLSLSLK